MATNLERTQKFQTSWGTMKELQFIAQLDKTEHSTRLQVLQRYKLAMDLRQDWEGIDKGQCLAVVEREIKKEMQNA